MGTRSAVAVVVPSYNPGRYLDMALRTVREQTFRDCHIYVVDDGSSPAVVLDDDLDLTVVRRKNAGVSRARNFAVSLGAEPLVAFLDQDDLWHPEKLARQVALLADRPEASGCFTWAHQVDAAGSVQGGAYGAYDHDIVGGRAFGGGVILSSLVVRRSAFLEAGGFDPTLRIVQDWDLLARVSLVGPVLACRERLTSYRVHDQNTSKDFRRLSDEARSVLKRLEPALDPSDHVELRRAERDFARLVAGKGRAYAREAQRQGRIIDAVAAATWSLGRSVAATVADLRARGLELRQ